MTSREAGIQPYRVEFVRETTEGTTPADPAWNLFSDNARTFEPSLSPNIEAQDGLGDPDSAGSYAGTEQTELSVMYDLQQWIVTGGGAAQDASYDGIARNSDNRLPNSQTVVRRIDITGLDAGNTINGSTSLDTRLYFVGKGGKIDTATLTPNIDTGQPVSVELAYMFTKGRHYQVDQPASSTTLEFSSSDAGDTTQSLTIEDEGAGTSETNMLNGTTTVTTTASFADIDAISLDAETIGDVTITDGTNDLAVLYGQSSYDQGEGDLGIPALGSGSHASALGSAYELPLDGDTFQRGGTDLGDNIMSVEMSVANNLTSRSQHSGPRPVIDEGKREAEVSATVFGQVESYQHTIDMLRTDAGDYVWTASDPSGSTGTVTLSNMKVVEVGQSEEAQQGVIEVDVTLGQQEGVTLA